MSSAHLRLLIFLLAILIPSCASSSPAFLMMYSAYKLNKQGDNIQLWHTSFPIWNRYVVPCPVLTVASWHAYRFLKRQVRWSGIPISFRIFHSTLKLYKYFICQLCLNKARKWKWKSFSHVWLFIQSMDYTVHGIFQARVLEWLPFPSPGDLPKPGIKARSPSLQVDSYQLSHKGSPRILERVACPFSRESSLSRNWTGVSCIAGGFFISWPIREANKAGGG